MQTIIVSNLYELQTHAREELERHQKEGATVIEHVSRDFRELEKYKNIDTALYISPYYIDGGWESIDQLVKSYNINKLFTPYSHEEFDHEYLQSKSIIYAANSGANSESVAQHAFSLSLQIVSRQNELKNIMPDGLTLGRELVNLQIGIIGMGKIGVNLYKKLEGFGVENIVFYSKNTKDLPNQTSFEDVVSGSDVMFITLSSNEETKKLFTDNFYQLLQGKYIVDITASKLLDKEKLVNLVQQKILAGAAFETEEEEFLHGYSENIISTAHMAWATKEAEEKCYRSWLQKN
jgi:lactate dehydrogenase-like 2-hydroxyacid dehydrogenase